MKVTYCGPMPAVIVQGQRCARGESIDVAADVAKSLATTDEWTTTAAKATKQED